MANKELSDRCEEKSNAQLNREAYRESLNEFPLILEKVPALDYEISEDDKIGGGGEAKVYSLGESCIGKVLHCPNSSSKRFYNNLLLEGISQAIAYKRGINAPRVEGIFKIKRKEDGKFWPVLVMRGLEGFKFEDSVEASQVSDEVYYFHLDLGKKEHEKASSLGIKHVDVADNMFACPKENKTYLIDWSDAEIEGVDFKEIKMEKEE